MGNWGPLLENSMVEESKMECNILDQHGVIGLVLLLATFVGGGEYKENYDLLPPLLRFSRKQYEMARDLGLVVVGKTSSPHALIRAAKMGKLQPVRNSSFPCDVSLGRSNILPDSVHKLRPGDISVVGALGESITAGSGATATAVRHVYTENRGLSWSIGGQGTWREFLTLPNILKEFNPNLVGFSLDDSFTHHKASQFNVAEPAARSHHLPHMASVLVRRIKADPRVNFNKDWKLITVMMGSNDFCFDMCYGDFKSAPERHRKDLRKLLNYLRDNLPRTLVNLVISPNLRIVMNFKRLKRVCEVTRLGLCPCLFGERFRRQRPQFLPVMEEWQQVELEVAQESQYKGRKDFAVVAQTFTQNLSFPTKKDKKGREATDQTYLSEDCHHFSQKAYARASNALWNNMLEPVGSKSTDWTKEFTKFLCPTEERPYIYTSENNFRKKLLV
ncbi:phospholipase B1, membrane-associated-like [Lycorma delicatula]|uniref:phospholipase B1, membrane-associated-like n=1 Tax=Lycorma delicatula TaxID=130591 RepID=UPI003F513C67